MTPSLHQHASTTDSKPSRLLQQGRREYAGLPSHPQCNHTLSQLLLKFNMKLRIQLRKSLQVQMNSHTRRYKLQWHNGSLIRGTTEATKTSFFAPLNYNGTSSPYLTKCSQRETKLKDIFQYNWKSYNWSIKTCPSNIKTWPRDLLGQRLF